ncbi:hypothetical protein C8Q74DRAFT_963398 [Fomes fomentarius]|nr:hypothetical protein C8Q74DRAFT_963398 [Fomes fomentarius]
MSTVIRQPLGKRFLMRKSSNTENLPPTAHSKKADALVSAREASRRRRARVVSGALPLKVKKVVQNAQRRASKALLVSKPIKPVAPQSIEFSAPSEPLELVNETQATSQLTTSSSAKPLPAPSMWHFPRFLRRPPPQVWPVPVQRENIDACNPELVDTPTDYIMQGLEVAGESMWNLVKNARVGSSSMGHRAALPDEVNVIIADHTKMQSASTLPPSHPTHVLAIWDLPVSQPVTRGMGVNMETGRRKVSLIAAHNLVLATHCAKWFPLPSSTNVQETTVSNRAGVSGIALNLPVVPLAVPHPASFMYLLQTLYTHKVSWLLDQLVPVPKPTVVFPTAENPQPKNPQYIVETSRRLAARFTLQAIVAMIGTVIGLWQNAIYLGVSDKRLWVGIDWSYDMLLTGLAISLGRPDLVPRPQPQMQWPSVLKA